MTGRSTIDWTEARERLARARRALERGDADSSTDAARVLELRARRLAQPVETAPEPVDALDVLVVELAGERHAIEVEHVLEVLPAGPLTPVPCTPAFVLGVTNVRGRVLPVLDLVPVLGIATAAAERSHVVVVEADAACFGIAADGFEGPVRREAGQLEADMVGVLDVRALVADRRLEVGQ
jgi:purine-binding chemotaxis protein CheW